MTAPKSYAAIVSSREYRIVRKALVREFVASKPSVREAHALDGCALAMERARLAQRDPTTTADMECKLAAAARHWRSMLAALADERKERLGTRRAYGELHEAHP
jgi:hypothetical protein